jgi:hypothetical protein
VKLGIMQPYFFPYAQHFRHIAQCDRWIAFDTVKFTRKSWMSRNRIANRDTEWSYISAPVAKRASNGTVSEAVLGDTDWRAELRDKLRVYKGAAPFFDETMETVEACIAPPSGTLAELNTQILKEACRRVGIGTQIQRLSEMDLALPDHAEAGEWALVISRLLNASVYSNAPGGRHLFDPKLYAREGVDLEFYEPIPLQHPTPGFPFTPNLSVIDTLMWVGGEALAAFTRR